ncbi:MAG: PfkB family carbohydrate kinase [Bacteroidales bacterium]
MRKIFTLGESLIDIIFRNGIPQAAKAGGAMLNTSVSLGRTGMPISFISEYGADDPGKLIDRFLAENEVDTSCVHRFTDGNTALALAFLDENNDAHYTFYKNYPQNRFDIKFPEINAGDIFLFGSIYAITREIRSKIIQLVTSAHYNKALIIYDPNFRTSHLHELSDLKPMIIENISKATLVRGSHEDFRNIFGSASADEAWEAVCSICKCIIYTNGTEGVSVRTPSFSGEFPVKKIVPVSTIGAGDNFNAGLITAIFNKGITNGDIPGLGKPDWEEIILTAVDFATEACMSYDNYIGLAFASKYRSASRFQI